MATLPTSIVSAYQLANANATIFTCPAATVLVVKRALLTNTDVGNHQVTLYVVRSGGSVGTPAKQYAAFSVTAGDSLIAAALLNLVLQAGDTIQGFADTAAVVNFNLDGYTLGTNG